MTVLSFSTMWAQQERFRDLLRFRDTVAAMGYDAIEVSHSTGEEGLKALLTAGAIPLTSLHAPTPHRKLPDGRANGDANLASLDMDVRQLAIEETLRTIEYAADAGLRYVVVHLGGVGDRMTDAERGLRRLVEAGEGGTYNAENLHDELVAWRADHAPAHIEAAARSLETLVRIAAPRDLAIGIESRLHYHEIPHPHEALDLLAPYNNTEAGYWHDVGHCEVQARLGLIDRASWFPALTSRCIGSHLHDVNGIVDHRAPGNGDVDWRYIAEGLPPDALRVFEIDQRQADADVENAIAFLRERNVV
jgi:sugar phosphate isomerase/epimerase